MVFLGFGPIGSSQGHPVVWRELEEVFPRFGRDKKVLLAPALAEEYFEKARPDEGTLVKWAGSLPSDLRFRDLGSPPEDDAAARLIEGPPWVVDELHNSPEQNLVLDHFVEHSDRLITDLPLSQVELLRLSSREFEELIAGVWRKFGYEVELTARTRDGGRDVVAVRRAELNARVLIECKRFAKDKRLGVGLVRGLYGSESERTSDHGDPRYHRNLHQGREGVR